MKTWQQIFVVTLLIAASCTAMKIDLAQLLASAKHRQAKRQDGVVDYNPCTKLEKPFPCRREEQCIPLNFVCDENYDCDDGSDENEEMCTAVNRPAVDDMKSFILKEKSWILPHILGEEDIDLIVHYLAVSPNVQQFREKVGLPIEQYRNLRKALKAIKRGDESTLREMGMPPNAWDEVKFMFGKLIKSGFY